ncbi:acyl-CoA synthetase [Mycobacterium sp. 21AC1]|uniref:acyl-CoA synthetase n=1 Tax=[Mycobacterium] appelbergii TaxID=2939269 RepID=UPI0029393574|nr:acyl-CoA synthetase [Mycobacterium sp. 21AC1]MDV3124505.1 acyl-CoA synthetase [Mycobacterium sp. 21AC1]
MSASKDPSVNGDARQKVDEDDHDLLTFGEAGERLRLEIAAASAHLDQLQISGTPTGIETARARLVVLRAAAQRNAAQPINDVNFEKFFGYPGRAKRNLPGPAVD